MVDRRNKQRAQMSAQKRKRKCAKGHKRTQRAPPCKDCKQPGLEQPRLGTPDVGVSVRPMKRKEKAPRTRNLSATTGGLRNGVLRKICGYLRNRAFSCVFWIPKCFSRKRPKSAERSFKPPCVTSPYATAKLALP